MWRDKTYVRMDNDMLFNVTGYEHPPGQVFASLKYAGGEKWTRGYEAAKQWLSSEEPDFVGEFISIPIERIVQVYHPQFRWAELLRGENVSPLHREALELGNRLREILQLPISLESDHDTEFGITDSLLWGEGGPNSDIDLVVIGRENGDRLQKRAEHIYSHRDFARPDSNEMKAPYGLSVDDWPRILSRKLHMGSFRDRLFSVRVVLRDDEVNRRPILDEPVGGSIELDFLVDDRRDSLLFPAVYLNEQGDELVDYSVVYEGVFRAGDLVHCECSQMIRTGAVGSKRPRNRFVLNQVIRWSTSCG